jgi:hypothetical protein
MNLTRFYVPFSGIRQGAITPLSSKLQGMQSFQIVGQTNQGPLATSSEQATQGKLTEAQRFLDDANDRLNRRFAQAVDAFADGGPQLVGHEFFGRSLLGQWLKII